MQRSGNGVLVLILGILSWVGFGCLTGLPAWIMGNGALKDIQRGVADPSELGIVQVGRILGMLNCLLVLFGAAIWIIFFGGIVTLGILSSHSR